MAPKDRFLGAVRRRTMICCRNVKISASIAARDRNRSTTARTMSLTRSLITDQHRPILGQPPVNRFATGTGTRSQRPGALGTNRGWKRPFDDPIPLPRGRQLLTLEDAGTYITKMPKAEHEAAEWQAAMEALILVATLGGPMMFARIGVMRALNRGHVREFDSTRKDHHWGKRKLKRGMS